MRTLPAVILLALLSACGSMRRWSADHRLVDASTHQSVSLDALADELATYDVVFLGEIHTSQIAHRLQAETFARLVDRRPEVVLTLEMFERDVQAVLDDYLAGRIDEAEFLAGSRPWKTYERDYRPLIELARERGLPVVAANLPRDTARKISKQGLASVEGDAWMPLELRLDTPEYRERFGEAMEEHLEVEQFDFFYASQVAKDEAMAESIAAVLEVSSVGGLQPEAAEPLVVHLCGRFHSDFHLGTVQRLARRRPDLRLAVVTTVEVKKKLDRALTAEEQRRGDWVWLVLPSELP